MIGTIFSIIGWGIIAYFLAVVIYALRMMRKNQD